ncbi:MAG: hypothetical protein LBK94_00850 [Prevotellaceae bacterium]|jgi:hypothetical protein|nr:hypothetical protein [Prevotellaceae bacterium]
MFFGTTPQIVSQYLHGEIKRLNPQRIFIPFAGNFVCEQIAHLACPDAEIFSTDVSIYSRAIGFGVNDIDFHLELTDLTKRDFPFLSDKKKPIEKAAIVILFSEIAKTYLKKDKIKYYDNLYNDAKHNIETYFNQVLNKLLKFKEISKFKFFGIDACEVLKDVKKGDFVFYDPPVLLGDYEKMFETINKCLLYDEVAYTQMTEELKREQIKEMHEKGAIIYWRTNGEVSDLPECLSRTFHYQYKWSSAYHVYSNVNSGSFVGRFEPLKEIVKNIQIIGKDDEITENSTIDVVLYPSNVGNHYRLMWVKKAQMSNAGWYYLVFIDKKLIGLLQLESGLKFGSDYVVIFSDPVSSFSKYRKLSKLILYLCCTKEMLKTINDLSMWEHIGFTTRVFTNNAVSMKYRGLFELTERKEDKASDYNNILIYHSKKHLDTFRDGLKEWLKKYSKDTK